MLKKRLIPVLILRDGQVVQSIQFRHTNVIHYDPVHAVECFNRWAVDELVILNVSKTADSAEQFAGIIQRISRECFVPLTVGGWITSPAYGIELLHSGADKLVVNTILEDDPDLVTELSARLGRQCIVASMDIKQKETGEYTILVDRGSRDVGVDPVEWAVRAQKLGAGEIFINSIDHDGNRKGYALEPFQRVIDAVSVPVIVMGGVLLWDHLLEGLTIGADAVAAANIFHYTEQSTKRAKKAMEKAGIPVRR